MLRLLSRFIRALFQFSKRAAGEATKFGRSGVKLLGVVGAARLREQPRPNGQGPFRIFCSANLSLKPHFAGRKSLL
jgi:hypothetical protein